MTYPPPPGPGDQSQPPDPAAYAPVYPSQQPAYQQPGYAPQPAYPYAAPAYQYGYGGYPYGYPPYGPPARPTDGIAIASLVVSCVSIFGLCAYGVGGLLGIVGAVLGHVARRRVKASGADGDGMALAGVIIGWIAAAIGILSIVGIILLFTLSEGFDPTTTT